MPRRVAVSVKNWAMTKRTLAAMSLVSRMSNEVKARPAAVRNEPAAIAFSM